MIKKAPSPLAITFIVTFTLACIGLLLMLWLSFGGTIPFATQGYRFEVPFDQANELYNGADVRISGISVGQVVADQLDPRGNRMLATIQLDPGYAPIHRDARAILRTKTILGETYVQITPGTPGSPKLPDGGELPRGQVQQAVSLDQVLNAFDPATRRGLRTWQQQLGKALNGRGAGINNALGTLPDLATNADDVLSVLDTQRRALGELVRTSGVLFRVLDRHAQGVHGLITNSAAVFAATASQRAALRQAFSMFPAFLDQTKSIQARVQQFAGDADPVVRELTQPTRDVAPTLSDLHALAPNLTYVFHQMNPLIAVSRTGLPALRDTLRATDPLLHSLGPFLDQLNPVLGYLQLQSRLVSDFISQGAQALNARVFTSTPGSAGHYLRNLSVVGLESAGIFHDRPPTERGITYPPPPRDYPIPDLDKFLDQPSWDCMNTGAPGNGTTGYQESQPGAHAGCWLNPNAVFEGRNTRFPYVEATSHPKPAAKRGR